MMTTTTTTTTRMIITTTRTTMTTRVTQLWDMIEYSFKMGHTDRQTQIPKRKQENFENDEKKYVFFRLSLMKTRTDVKIKSEAFKYKKHV